MTEATYEGRKMETDDIEHVLGTDIKHTWPHDLGAASAVQQVRFQIEDSDGVVWVDKALDSHADDFDLSTDGLCEVTVHDTDTVDLDISKTYNYGLQFVDQQGIVYIAWSGKWKFRDGIIDDTGSSPSATWRTREELDAEIDTLETSIYGMASVNDMAIITIDAPLGAGSFTVHDSDVYADYDVIKIQLDDGNYDDAVVASAVGGLVTLVDHTLTAAASAGNVVLKVPE